MNSRASDIRYVPDRVPTGWNHDENAVARPTREANSHCILSCKCNEDRSIGETVTARIGTRWNRCHLEWEMGGPLLFLV